MDPQRDTADPTSTQSDAVDATDGADGEDARRAGELVLRVAEMLDAMFRDATAGEDLDPFDVRLLAAAARRVPQASLAAALGTDPSRVSNVSAKLEQRGLLRRIPARGDRRVRYAELTDEGHAAVKRVGDRLTATSPLLHRLDAEDRRTLTAVLSKLVNPA